MATISITEEQATFLLDIAEAQPMPRVPVRYARDRDHHACALERLGLVERHYVGKHYGAFVTEAGNALLITLKQTLNR